MEAWGYGLVVGILGVLLGKNASGPHFSMGTQFLSLTGPQGMMGQHLEWRGQSVFGIHSRKKDMVAKHEIYKGLGPRCQHDPGLRSAGSATAHS